MHKPPGRILRVLTLGGMLRVRVCELCGALVHAHATDHHATVHRAELGRADRRPGRP